MVVSMTATLDLDVVVPVFNEAAALEASVRRLHGFLSDGFPFSWRIVIADNASTDATPVIARRLAAELPRVALAAARRQGARSRPTGRLVGLARTRGRLHGRRPID